MKLRTNKIKLKDLPDNLKEHFLLNFLNKLNPNILEISEKYDTNDPYKLVNRYKKIMLKYIQSKFDNIYLDLNKESIKDNMVIFFIHKQTNIDLIGQQIENDCFDWFKSSRYIPQFCPKYFNSEKFNWEYVEELIWQQPKLFDSEKFNQDKYSYLIPMYCPEYFDVQKYNQDKYTEVAMAYVPELIDNDKINKNFNFKRYVSMVDHKYYELYRKKERQY